MLCHRPTRAWHGLTVVASKDIRKTHHAYPFCRSFPTRKPWIWRAFLFVYHAAFAMQIIQMWIDPAKSGVRGALAFLKFNPQHSSAGDRSSTGICEISCWGQIKICKFKWKSVGKYQNKTTLERWETSFGNWTVLNGNCQNRQKKSQYLQIKDLQCWRALSRVNLLWEKYMGTLISTIFFAISWVQGCLRFRQQ